MADFNQTPSDQPTVALSLPAQTLSATAQPAWQQPSWGGVSGLTQLSFGIGGSAANVFTRLNDGRLYPRTVPTQATPQD